MYLCLRFLSSGGIQIYLLFILAGCMPEGEKTNTYPETVVEENSSVDSEGVISLYQGNRPEGIPLDSIIEKVEYLPLKENIFLENVFYMRFWEDYILTFTSTATKSSASVFNHEGRGLFQVGKMGEGPGEYFNIEGIQFNSFDRTIDLISVYPSRIMQYDMEGGRFLREIPLFEANGYANFLPVDSDRYLFTYQWYSEGYPDVTHHFLVYNAQTRTIEAQFLPFREDEVLGNAPFRSRITFTRDDTAVYTSYFNDPNIYAYTFADKGIQRAYTLNFGKPFASDLIRNGNYEFERVYKEKSVCCIRPFVVTDHYVFGVYDYEDFLGNSFVYSRKSGKIVEYRTDELVNTFNGLGLFPYNIVGIRENQVVVSALPFELAEAVESHQDQLIPEESQRVREILDQVDRGSGNPILMFYTFKEF